MVTAFSQELVESILWVREKESIILLMFLLKKESMTTHTENYSTP